MNVRYRRELYKLLPLVSESVCVELGCAEAYNSAEILSWGVKTLYMVDAWETMPHLRGDAASPQAWHDKNYRDAVKRVEKYAGSYEILRGPTTKMAGMIKNDSCDLVYVDADHSYEGVKADIDAYWPKLKTGGVMAFHDYEAPQYGVKQAVTEFAQRLGIRVFYLAEDKREDAGAYVLKP